MTIQDTVDVRVALRLPRWLHEDLEDCAERSCWDLSKQIRYELASIRGKAPTPYLPPRPNQDKPTRRKSVGA